MRSRFFCLLLGASAAFTFPQTVSAWTLLSHSEKSSTAGLEAIKGYGLFDHDESAPFAFDSWSLAASGAQSQVQDTTGAQTTLNTRDYTGSLGFSLQKNWNLRFAFDAASTSEVKYTDRGLTVGVGYTFEYGSKNSAMEDEKNGYATTVTPPAEKEDFVPSVSINLQLGHASLKQDLNFKTLGIRTFEMDQNSIGLDASWDLARQWSLFTGLTVFNYNKSKDDLAAATLTKVSTLAVNSLLSTIEGVPSTRVSVGASFYPADRWEETLVLSTTKMFVDNSVLRSGEFDVRYRFLFGLIAGLGFRHSTEDSIATDTFLADLGYRF